MARMKKGAKLGKVDCAYTEIKVGDVLRNKHTGAEYTVTSYGSLDNGKEVLPKWSPDDYRVVKTWDAVLKEEHDAKAAKEDPVPEEAVKAEDKAIRMTCEEFNNELRKISSGDSMYSEACRDSEGNLFINNIPVVIKEEEEEAKPDPLDATIACMIKARDMVRELRFMGYDVTCMRTVFVEL